MICTKKYVWLNLHSCSPMTTMTTTKPLPIERALNTDLVRVLMVTKCFYCNRIDISIYNLGAHLRDDIFFQSWVEMLTCGIFASSFIFSKSTHNH